MYCQRCGKEVNTFETFTEWEPSVKFVEKTVHCGECGLFLYRILEEVENEN